MYCLLFSVPDVLSGELTSLNLHGGAEDKEFIDIFCKLF